MEAVNIDVITVLFFLFFVFFFFFFLFDANCRPGSCRNKTVRRRHY
jgi:hypothetical protein